MPHNIKNVKENHDRSSLKHSRGDFVRALELSAFFHISIYFCYISANHISQLTYSLHSLHILDKKINLVRVPKSGR